MKHNLILMFFNSANNENHLKICVLFHIILYNSFIPIFCLMFFFPTAATASFIINTVADAVVVNVVFLSNCQLESSFVFDRKKIN